MSKDKMQVPSQDSGKQPAFPTDLAYNSTTPIVNVPPEASGTTVSTENSYQDGVAQQAKMDNDQQLAFRCKPMNAGRPWSLDGGEDTVPNFQAGELKDEDVPPKKAGY